VEDTVSSLQTEVDQSELILVGAGPATGSINTGVSSIRTRPRALAPRLLDGKARAAGLLGERQRITDAKAFKRTKKRLGVRSIRDGFGRSGLWLWQLPARTKVTSEPAVELTLKPAPEVAYVEDHSRPEQRDDGADHETDARKEGILGARQHITDAKAFKRAKKKLGVHSLRDGFGRDGLCLWQLPAGTKVTSEPAVELTPKPLAEVAYVEDHWRPEPPDHDAEHGTDKRIQGDPVLAHANLQYVAQARKLVHLRSLVSTSCPVSQAPKENNAPVTKSKLTHYLQFVNK
jgi:hypothetical protein